MAQSSSTNGSQPLPEASFTYTPELSLLSIGSSTTVTDTIYFAGAPVAQALSGASSSTRYLHTDHLGTPLLAMDGTGTITWWAEQEPFGSVWTLRAGTASEDPLLRFPGQDAASGIEETYNIFRWYRGGWGRYSQADPIGLDGGLNLYRYAEANPLTSVDPFGLDSRVCCRPIQGLFGGPFFGYKHCYVESNSRGRRETWGLYNIKGYGEPRKNYQDDLPQAGTKCTRWFADDCKDGDCFTKAANSYPYQRYSYAAGSGLPLASNSNTFARCVWNACKPMDTGPDWKSIFGPVATMAPGWNRPCPK
jgi:RHS repeat-associated protein